LFEPIVEQYNIIANFGTFFCEPPYIIPISLSSRFTASVPLCMALYKGPLPVPNFTFIGAEMWQNLPLRGYSFALCLRNSQRLYASIGNL